MASIEEYFQQAKEKCIQCYYAFHDKHNYEANICHTTSNKEIYIENAMNALQTIINSNGAESYWEKIAIEAQKICRRKCIGKDTGKPKSKSIADFLRARRV